MCCVFVTIYIFFFPQYINTLVSGITKYKDFKTFKQTVDTFIQTIESIKEKRPEFMKQLTFKNLITNSENDIQQCTSFEHIPDYNSDLILELKRFLKPAVSNSSESKNLSPKKCSKLVKEITHGKVQILTTFY